MAEINVESRRMLVEDPEADRRDCERWVAAFMADADAFLAPMIDALDPVDIPLTLDPDRKALMIAQLQDAFQSGAEGWFEDDMLTVTPWGFALEDVKPEVWLWHGELDRLVPVSHGRRVAERLPRCQALFLPNDGHISPIGRVAEILAWLAEPLRLD